MNPLLSAAGSRGVVLIASLICTAASSRIIFQNFGSDVFGMVTLIATIQYMIPFADLGLGAAVMNSVARWRSRRRDEAELLEVFRAAKVLIIVFAAAVLVILFVIGSCAAAGLHDFVIGRSMSIGLPWAAVALIVIALNVPLSLGNRILVGLDRTHIGILCSAASPPFILASTYLIYYFRMDAAALYILWPVASALGGILTLVPAARGIDVRLPDLLVRSLRAPLVVGGSGLLGTAGSMFSISVASPLLHGSHRVILSSFAAASSVASYSVAAQVYSPMLSLMTAAATPLWSRYAALSSAQEPAASGIRGVSVRFLGVGVMGSLVVLGGTPIYGYFVTGAWTYVDLWTLGAFAFLLMVNSACLPLMMRLNTGRALHFQAKTAVASCVIGLPVSMVLAHLLGASGPVWASIIGLAVAQLVPMVLYMRRRSLI